MNNTRTTCTFCQGELSLIAHYTSPPKGETDFGIAPYSRYLKQCIKCDHIINEHCYDFSSNFYEGQYSHATYQAQVEHNFAKIMSLPPSRSDNRQRVAYVTNFTTNAGWKEQSTCLDVGSGLGVFPAALKEIGWHCVALDPDPTACASIEKLAKVRAITGDLMNTENLGSFDLISFNKVLEHVSTPWTMLERSADFLKPGGFLYLEVPDGKTALSVCGPDREEFFIEHYDAYSKTSLETLIKSSGFQPISISNIREPSGKFTLRAFVEVA